MSSFVITTLVTLASVGASPAQTHLEDQVDLIEINHLYDLNGQPLIHQLIFYQWDPAAHRYQVRAWRLLKSPDQFPRKNWNQDLYVCQWRDMRVYRKVYAKEIRETWTTHDPEVLERKMYPIEKRGKLSQPEALSAKMGLVAVEEES